MSKLLMSLGVGLFLWTGCGPGLVGEEDLGTSEDELQEEELGELSTAEAALEVADDSSADIVEEDPADYVETASQEEADYADSDGTLPDDPTLLSSLEEPAEGAVFPSAETGSASFEVAAAAAPPRFQAFFADPFGTDAQRMALETALIRIIDRAKPGATLRASWFLIERTRVIKALQRAEARKVKVTLVLDGRAARIADSKRELGELRSVRFCKKPKGQTACIGSRINHNKFVTISASTDGSRYLVWQSSANLRGGTIHDNAIVVRGNKKLYDTFVSYSNDLLKNPSRPNLKYNRAVDAKGGTKVYFSPSSKTDAILSAMNNVKCSKSGRNDTVRVAMSWFYGTRGLRLVKKLDAMAKAGCAVEVLIAVHPSRPRVSDEVTKALKGGAFALRNYAFSEGHHGIHSKYMLIDAPYGSSKTRRQLVFTGSHNWTTSALKYNDEALLRVTDPAVFRAFLTDYARIRKHTNPM